MASDELFQLIKSLTRTEKRYFKMFASIQNKEGNNIYLKFFNAIESQKEYDEKAIKAKFKGERFTRQLTVTKHYLINFILKSLRIYHHNSSAESQANHLLLNIEILFNKELYDLCSKQIEKLKTLALKYELYAQFMEALSWERKLIYSEHFVRHNFSDIKKIIAQQKNGLLKLENINQYQELQLKWFCIYIKRGGSRNISDMKYYTSAINSPFIKDEAKAITNNSKYIYYNLKYIIAYDKRDLESSIGYSKKMLDFFEQHPEQIVQSPDTFSLAIYNLAVGLLTKGEYEEALLTLDKNNLLQTLKLGSREKNLKLKIFGMKSHIYNITGAFDQTLALLPEIESGIKEFKHYESSHSYLIIVNNIVCAYIGIADFKNALKWLNKILNSKETIAEDIHCYARIINLIIHFEMKDEELLTYITKSTHRYLYKKNRLYKVESSVLNFIKKTSKMDTYLSGKQAKKELIIAFKELREELIQLSHDSYEAIAFEYFDFISWLESKIENRSFAEVVKKKAMK